MSMSLLCSSGSAPGMRLGLRQRRCHGDLAGSMSCKTGRKHGSIALESVEMVGLRYLAGGM